MIRYAACPRCPIRYIEIKQRQETPKEHKDYEKQLGYFAVLHLKNTYEGIATTSFLYKRRKDAVPNWPKRDFPLIDITFDSN